MILPHSGNLFQNKVPAGFAVGNGFGKFAGATQVEELGEIETPIWSDGPTLSRASGPASASSGWCGRSAPIVSKPRRHEGDRDRHPDLRGDGRRSPAGAHPDGEQPRLRDPSRRGARQAADRVLQRALPGSIQGVGRVEERAPAVRAKGMDPRLTRPATATFIRDRDGASRILYGRFS